MFIALVLSPLQPLLERVIVGEPYAAALVITRMIEAEVPAEMGTVIDWNHVRTSVLANVDPEYLGAALVVLPARSMVGATRVELDASTPDPTALNLDPHNITIRRNDRSEIERKATAMPAYMSSFSTAASAALPFRIVSTDPR
jgi:hypothetical protein